MTREKRRFDQPSHAPTSWARPDRSRTAAAAIGPAIKIANSQSGEIEISLMARTSTKTTTKMMITEDIATTLRKSCGDYILRNTTLSSTTNGEASRSPYSVLQLVVLPVRMHDVTTLRPGPQLEGQRDIRPHLDIGRAEVDCGNLPRHDQSSAPQGPLRVW